MSTADVVTSARVALANVLADGLDARLSDLLAALRLGHRALGVAEREMSTPTSDETDETK